MPHTRQPDDPIYQTRWGRPVLDEVRRLVKENTKLRELVTILISEGDRDRQRETELRKALGFWHD